MKNTLALSLLFAASLAQAKNLESQVSINAGDLKGQTYFTFMKETVKPHLDQIATEGFKVVDGERMVSVLANVGKKVSSSALRAAGDKETLGSLGDELEGQSATFYELPAKIAKANSHVSRYDLTTYLALASGAGVAIELDEKIRSTMSTTEQVLKRKTR